MATNSRLGSPISFLYKVMKNKVMMYKVMENKMQLNINLDKRVFIHFFHLASHRNGFSKL